MVHAGHKTATKSLSLLTDLAGVEVSLLVGLECGPVKRWLDRMSEYSYSMPFSVSSLVLYPCLIVLSPNPAAHSLALSQLFRVEINT